MLPTKHNRRRPIRNREQKLSVRRLIDRLAARAAAKIGAAVARIEAGNFGDVKPVGEGVSERRIDFGPGYRMYFGQDGPKLVILLVGGTKRRQQRDIDQAKAYWSDYKR